MPLVTQKVNLKDSFQYTNLDLEDSGPTSVSSYGHQQNFTPTDAFADSSEGSKTGGKLKDNGFKGSDNLDVEDNGPTSVPLYNHQQQWSPAKPFNQWREGFKGKLYDGNPNTPDYGFEGPYKLDLENNGPKWTPTYVQQWTPSSKFTQDGEGSKGGGKLRHIGFDGPEQLDIESDPRTFFKKSPSGKQSVGFTQQWGPNVNDYQGADLGDEGIGLFNKNNSLAGNLDIENNPPLPASTGKNGGIFVQKYTPKGQFINSPEGDVSSNKLENNSLAGNLDIENNPPIPASAGKNGGTFIQKYSPNSQFINSPEGDVSSEKLEDNLDKAKSNNAGLAGKEIPASFPSGEVQRSFVSSSLDLENPSPNGGPNHAPLNGHTQVYTPKNTYLDSPEGQLRSNDSPAERDNFKTSALDIENNIAGVRQGGKGGPTNVSYTTKIGSETKTFNTTNPYIPEKTYTNLFQLRGDIDVSRLRDSYK